MSVYKIGSYTKTELNLSSLELDCENFRIGHQDNQPDALKAMLTRSNTKLIGIATSIVENGFFDLELPCVFQNPKTKHYIVAEGNRRITALKVLHTPDLAHGTKLHSEFKHLHQKAGKKLPSKVQCAVFKNRKDCLAYVLMRHGFGTDGAGLMKWDSISKLRADEYVNGTSHPEMRVIDFVLSKGHLTQANQQKLNDDDFNITNLQRVTDDSSVKTILGITADCTISTHGEKWLAAVWQKVVEIIIEGQHRGDKFTVDKNINTTTLRKQFIHEVIEDVHGTVPSGGGTSGSGSSGASSGGTSSSGTQSGGSGQGQAGGQSSGSGSSSGGSKGQSTKNRKGLIAKSFVPAKLKPQKITNIVGELKKLSVLDFLNCSGVMFRVFFELSIVHYMKAHNISKVDAKGRELTLKEKTSAALSHLDANPNIDSKSLKPLRDLLKNSHPLSAESLNYYVHSSTHTPDANTLKTEWDNLQHIFDMLWEK